MKYIIHSFLLILCLFVPFNLFADHGCIDGRPFGHKIIVKKNLPTHWLTLGDKLISDPKLHTALRTQYSEHYISGKDGEGFTIDHFCGFKNGIFAIISNGDWGPYAEFSKETPKCYSCKPIKETIPFFTSGSGLTIGQDKDTVSSILGIEIKDDITSITFEEIKKGKNHRKWHSQTLRIEFQNNELMRFSISDFRERYD